MAEIGLPWLYGPGRHSDLWRQEFSDRVDAQAARKLDSDAAETAGDALLAGVEETTDPSTRTPWGLLATPLNSGPGQGDG